MNNYNVTVTYKDGNYSHTQNLKAENEKEAIKEVMYDKIKENEVIVNITVLEKPQLKTM